MFLFSYDMHCTNYGSVGALCQMVGTEISTVLATGTVWMRVPHTLRICLHGELRGGAHARDVGFILAHGFAAGRWGVEYDYRIVEFSGPGVASLAFPARVALRNSITDMGVNNVYFEPSADAIAATPYPDFASDADAQYEAAFDLDLSAIEPQVLVPELFKHIDPEFASRVQPGDFVVAGYDFGCGKPHGTGFIAMKALGMSILCESMPTRSHRNAVSRGLPILTDCAGVRDLAKTGDDIEVDFVSGAYRNHMTGAAGSFPGMPQVLLDIVHAGGTTGFLRNWLATHPELARAPG